ncbi:MAG: hypothetical protein WBC18_14845 [Ottowia sp.]|uniref:hypothetical protein n=1 Tax=Ottowia sp. TaxID=1898956 RepID=UPI003C76ECCD
MRSIGLAFLMAIVAFHSSAIAQKSGGHGVLVATAKREVAKDFKDPESARFRSIGIYKSKTGKGGVSVCGEVNAKNSYGAYVGYRKFVFSDGISAVDDTDSMYSSLGPALCHELVTTVK